MKNILFLITIISCLTLTACSTTLQTEVKKEIPVNNEITDPFYLNTTINKNSLIVDDAKSKLNGLTIVYVEAENIKDVEKFKIQIIPCKDMPLATPDTTERISDCFKVESGTKEEILVIYPDNLFTNYKQDIKNRNIKLWHYVDSRYATDVPEPGMWTGSTLSDNNNMKMVLDPTSYFGGYYFIGKSLDNKKIKI